MVIKENFENKVVRLINVDFRYDLFGNMQYYFFIKEVML